MSARGLAVVPPVTWMRLSNWFAGWRADKDGWLVRAIRQTDPVWDERPDIGFSEESSIVVRSHADAYAIDRGWHPVDHRMGDLS